MQPSPHERAVHHVLSNLRKVSIGFDHVSHLIFSKEALSFACLVHLPFGKTLKVVEVLLIEAWIRYPDIGKNVVSAVQLLGSSGICTAVEGFHAWWLWSERSDEEAEKGRDCYCKQKCESM